MRSTDAFKAALLVLGLAAFGCTGDLSEPVSNLRVGELSQRLTVDPLDLRGYGLSGAQMDVGGLAGTGCTQVSATYKIVNDTRDTANPYYISTFTHFVDSTAQRKYNNDGYIGLQTYTEVISPDYPPGKVAVFSMFDGGGQGKIVTRAEQAQGSVCRCGADGPCGTGYSCFR